MCNVFLLGQIYKEFGSSQSIVVLHFMWSKILKIVLEHNNFFKIYSQVSTLDSQGTNKFHHYNTTINFFSSKKMTYKLQWTLGTIQSKNSPKQVLSKQICHEWKENNPNNSLSVAYQSSFTLHSAISLSLQNLGKKWLSRTLLPLANHFTTKHLASKWVEQYFKPNYIICLHSSSSHYKLVRNL